MNAIIALNPQQMAEAQTTTTTWAAQKIEAAQRELHDAEQVAAALSGASLRRGQATAMIAKARTRLRFYEKVKAALDAGYYIVPPFPLQLFAIRTDRGAPTAERGERNWQKDGKARALAVGEGDYVNPNLRRVAVDKVQQPNHSGTGMREVTIYENQEAWGDVELPVRALKPQIITEVGRALELRIFDALGIAPAYRAADPIICGELHRPSGGVLTFFVAWWLDRSDL
jgi:hypothetical protein